MKLMTSEELPFHAVLNSLSQQICVLNESGVIEWVNDAWVQFSMDNGGDPSNVGLGQKYLEMCVTSPKDGETSGTEDFSGIKAVVENKSPSFELEYPCHSPTKKRWFMMEIRRMVSKGRRYSVVSHMDITDRKLAEEKVQELALMDSLTSLSNRRRFEEFLSQEWRRAKRLRLPISLALLDIDFFKQFNDHYGHVAGDECLSKVGAKLKMFGQRPGDLVARYGGEEFSVIMGETDLEGAASLADSIRAAIFDLNIPHEFTGSETRLTISLGVAMAFPHEGLLEKQLINAADEALYDAKASGRNCVSVNRSLISNSPEQQFA